MLPLSPHGRAAVFLDRDGVLIADHGYVHRAADVHWLPGVFDALRLFVSAGYLLVVVTNQSGIARGLYTEAAFEQLMQFMRRSLAARGLALAGVYHCPHHPAGRVAGYVRHCDCRKPAAGMLLRARDDLALDMEESLMIGDRPSDVAAGRAAGVGRCYLLQPTPGSGHSGADAVHDSLLGVARSLCPALLPRRPLPFRRPGMGS